MCIDDQQIKQRDTIGLMMNKPNDDAVGLTLDETTELLLAGRCDSPDSSGTTKNSKPMSEKKRRRMEMSEEERREERRAANRRSAFESRQRRKVLIEELQDTVQSLSKDNAVVRKEADSLRAQVEMLSRENRQLRLHQQIASSRLQLQAMPEPAPQLGSNFWGMQQGRNSNMGLPGLVGGLDQYIGADPTNVSPRLGGGHVESISRPAQPPQSDAFLTEQAREYLRSLQERKGSLL